ncbi:MAG: hypothetical protein AAF734_09285, partial [Bacteroidota bacterium]
MLKYSSIYISKDVRLLSTSSFLMLLLLFSACKKKRITRNIDPNIPDLVRADTIKEDIKIVETDFEYFSSKAK